jgi:hypothetical protein
MASENGDQANHPWPPPAQPISPYQPQPTQPAYPPSGPQASPPYQLEAHPGWPQPRQQPYGAPPQGYGQYGPRFAQ